MIAADALDDLEHARIAAENRARALRQEKDTPALAARQDGLAEALKALEDGAALELVRAMRGHPLGDWVERTPGVGLRQAARLLGQIGDPAERETPSRLWAYCGLHVIDGKRPRRQRGVQANWSTKAKSRAYLIAESCIKFTGGLNTAGRDRPRSPYRDVYERARENWADRDVADAHKHTHALSLTAKAILLDLWREARKIRGLPYDKRRGRPKRKKKAA